ncbi:MAG: TonB-dependent receptor plug domain-containing protein [Saprospiraceae bacterium]|nr:TonB-dependent receptor plug domain-containing protein [Saprospiraceae bacterium]
MKKILFLVILLTEALSAQDSLKMKMIKLIDTIHQTHNTLSDLFLHANKIESEDFNGGIIFSPLDLVQSRVPGFIYNNVNANDPNPHYSFQVRGISSLLSESNPSYFIDGVPVNSCDFIMPENIQSISLYPDMVSAAENFYPSTDGLFMINSKEAPDSNLRITYSAYNYFESYKEKYYRNAQQFRERIAYWKKFEEYTFVSEIEQLHDFGGDTDWLEVLSQQKFNHSHNLTFGKRIKNSAFNIMLTYKDFNGILKKNSSRILNGHLVISQSLFKERLKLNATLISNNKKYSQINYNPVVFVDSYYDHNIISYAEVFNPTVPDQDQAGYYPADTLSKKYILQNPLEILNDAIDERSSNTQFAVLNANFRLLKGLSFITGYSILKKVEITELFGTSKEGSDPFRFNSQLINKDIDYKQNNVLLALKYVQSFKKHNISIVLSNRIFYSDDKLTVYDSTRYSDNTLRLAKGVIHKKFSMNNLHAYITYFYSDIFGLNAGLHNDFIRLYDNHKDTMNYQPHIRASISLKKLFKNMEWMSCMNIVSSYTMKREPDSGKNSIFIWETEYRNSKDIGIETSILQNKVRLQLKFYNKKIFNTPFFVSGLGFYQFDIDNSGLEFKLQSKFNTVKFRLTQEFCFTYNKSHQISNVDHLTYYPLNVKVPIGNFKGYYYAGFADIVDVEKFTPLYYTEDGEKTDDQYKAKNGVIGNGTPKYFIGVFNKMNFKRFEISFLLKSAFGFEIRNLEYLGDFGNNNVGKNLTVTIPSYYIYTLRKDTDYGVLKGGYTKIDKVTVKYTIPFKKLKISVLEVYITLNNPYIFSYNYGIDPEMLSISAVEPGILNYKNYPETVIYQFGFSLKL